MSLISPPNVASRSVALPSARAFHAVGFTCLGAALVTVMSFQAHYPSDVVWPAALPLGPMAILLWLVDTRRHPIFSAVYVVVGACGIYVYVLTFSLQQPPINSGDAFSLDIIKIALVTVVGTGRSFAARMAWGLVGYVIAECASGAALLQTGHRVEFGFSTFLALAVCEGILVAAALSRRRLRLSQPSFSRAAHDEELSALRRRVEGKAAALLHDTVLSHLASIANSAPGSTMAPLQPAIEHDLEVLLGEEWLQDGPEQDEMDAVMQWQRSALFAAIQEARAMGLTVQETGDTATLQRLSRESSLALGLAVKQCLVNVLRHSGTDEAEVALYGSDSDISVMVVDTGRGFSEAETGADRLGLRNSVRRRMESVGGDVQVWSTPGRGTSIIIRVPTTSGTTPAPRDGDH